MRSQIKTGDILLFQGKSLLSRLVTLASGDLYSHTGIAAWWSDRLFDFHAIGKGVVLQPVSLAVDAYDGRVDWFAVRPERRAELDRDRLLACAQAELTTPYATQGVVLFGVRSLPRRRRRLHHARPYREIACPRAARGPPHRARRAPGRGSALVRRDAARSQCSRWRRGSKIPGGLQRW